MIYIINYNEYDEAKQYVNLQIIKHQINPEELSVFDWNQNNEIGLEFIQNNLFSTKKMYVVWNAEFLSATAPFQANEELFATLNSVSDEYEIYLLTNKKVLINKEFKALTAHWKTTKLKPMVEEDKKEIINTYLAKKKMTIPKEVYIQLLKKVDCNYGNIKNEVDKLCLLSQSENDQQCLIDSICSYNDENIFNLFEAIIMKKNNRIWEIYYDLSVNKVDEISVINTLATQIVNLYYVLKLLRDGLSINEVSSALTISVYFINIYKNRFINYNINILLDIAVKLYELEIDIKLSKVDKINGLKQFIINASK